jgi:hypothetical protein
MAFASMDDPEGMDRMREFMGPGQVDHQIRQAIQLAWILLPEGKRTIAEVEQVVRQLVDRALKEFREDGETFGKGS